MKDSTALAGFSAILLFTAIMQNNATAGIETPDTSSKKVMYQVCFKPSDKSKVTCEPEKLVIEQALKRCAELLKKFKFCEVQKLKY